MQRLCCLKCGHYLGRYVPGTAATIEEELYCFRCKGHTRFMVEEGALKGIEFVPNVERPRSPTASLVTA